MGKKRSGFTMIELSITIGVFAVFMLFFVGVFQVIFRSIQLNKQIAAKMYAETQLENAFALIARELQWGGSLSGNLATTTIQYTDDSTAVLTAFGRDEFGVGSATATLDGQMMKLKYAQVEKGILRKFSSYDRFWTDTWDWTQGKDSPKIAASFSDYIQNKGEDGVTTIPASKVYFSYIGGSELYLGTEAYWPKNSSVTAPVWVFSMDSLSESSPTTLTYWGPKRKPSESSPIFKTQVKDSKGVTYDSTGLYHIRDEELGDYLLTLAYQIPDDPPSFKGINITGGIQEYFGEVISKTTFWVEGGSKLKMSKYIPTVNATITQTLFEPIKAATFTILEEYVELELIYLIPDPANRGQSIEYRKTRKFWTLGAGG